MPAESDRAAPGDAVLDRLADVTARAEQAAAAAGRPGQVRVLLATKTVPAERIRVVLAAGHRLIGENRVQELVAKADDLADLDPRTHFIGHLQANKVNAVLPLVRCLETVDDAAFARRLQDRLEVLDRTLDVLVQVNVSGEASKSGVTPEGLPALLRAVAGFDRLRLRGLMTIGLNSPDLEAVRAGYRTLRVLRDRLRDGGLPGVPAPVDPASVTELSMGMSGDYELAVAEGATEVRVGAAVFGARAQPAPAEQPGR
ncbi:YggS family pyridoxal phosphate-dependent enzyme [Nakamurella endophytica]|uniref:Pyridoxal phosphate homeostasis protein n=1 Tax=Nakamurella endophytica TaxID=1748367 RepID=A0A917WGC8_9ACTN|nr:YggS family pyridoxal phosphate-dependent enzyme [Nakamurella endophytica]GGM01839.1 YggS family pyridoxal phosphate enzyme [Nakamurella endophytica]